jgi:hypothetical protein
MIQKLLFIPWLILRTFVVLGCGLCLSVFGIPAGVLCILCGVAIATVAFFLVLAPVALLLLFF